MMERKVICDLHLISVDFGREEERQPGNTFRITFRHANGQPTGTIDVYQGEAAHFAVELEAIAAFLRAALIASKKLELRHCRAGIMPGFRLGSSEIDLEPMLAMFDSSCPRSSLQVGLARLAAFKDVGARACPSSDGIHVLNRASCQRRGRPGQARP